LSEAIKVRETSPGGAGHNPTLGLRKLEKSNFPSQTTKNSSGSTDLQAQAATIVQARTDNQTELDALLPAILDRAFKGEL